MFIVQLANCAIWARKNKRLFIICVDVKESMVKGVRCVLMAGHRTVQSIGVNDPWHQSYQNA